MKLSLPFAARPKTGLVIGQPLTKKARRLRGCGFSCSLYNHVLFQTSTNRKLQIDVAQLVALLRLVAHQLPDPGLVVSVSTIHGHLALPDRARCLGNSRFVSLRWKVEMKLGVELERWALRCCRATDPPPAGRPRRMRVATQLSAASTRERSRAEDSIGIAAFGGQLAGRRSSARPYGAVRPQFPALSPKTRLGPTHGGPATSVECSPDPALAMISLSWLDYHGGAARAPSPAH